MTHLIPPGSLILTPQDARALYQAAKLGDLRQQYRVGDTAIYDLLSAISMAAFTIPADGGNLTRHTSAFVEHGLWTVHRVAIAAGLSERKVRLDCQQGFLPATKQGSNWIIEQAEADTYIARGRRR
ncbi:MULTISPECIES: hypothetical protein [unclassified Rathayibacter]|uniref:hypothetical protein n=1 Tax=unclassified Rathayibacter TaxID=2609250 RepID=UPI0011B0251B|nr:MULTISPECIES: hypothetical protein [unclassified Rathayibacter]